MSAAYHYWRGAFKAIWQIHLAVSCREA